MPVEIVEIPVSPNRTIRQAHVCAIVRHLLQRRFAVLPTDTGPMLACNALDPEAIEALFRLKGRRDGNPIHVAVPDMASAEKLVFMNGAARRVMESLLPGPLTVICPKRETVPDLLVAGTGNLGIRIPDSPAVLQICAAAGVPLTATSLNISGQSPRATIAETLADLHWGACDLVYNVVDPGQAVLRAPSTVVRILGESGAEILRPGPVEQERILAAIGTGPVSDRSD
jgi:L-threonylcarbamoyladenylate synthase